MMMRLMPLALAACLLSACGSSSPSAPSSSSPPPSTTPPVATTVTLSGIVNSAAGGPVVGATIAIQDGPNVGKSATTDGSGTYTFNALTASSFTVIVTAANYVSVGRTVTVSASQTSSFSLLPSKLWTVSGFGNTVFTMPGYFSRVHVTGHFVNNGSNSNFIVQLNSSLLINEILRNADYDGVHLVTGGGTVQITQSGSIQWTFTEVR